MFLGSLSREYRVYFVFEVIVEWQAFLAALYEINEKRLDYCPLYLASKYQE